jgi:prolipoprotein diacylglyceryltransferase
VTLGFDPVAFSIKGIPIRWYGLVAGPSIAVPNLIVRMLARRRGFLRDDVVIADGLKVAQIIAVAIALAGVAWLVTLRHPLEHSSLLEVRR